MIPSMSPSAHRLPPDVVVFGAFDRHNIGDLLFAHVAAAMLPDTACRFAGLAARDLSADGGHRAVPLAQALAACRTEPRPVVLHAGGELLTCTSAEAAVMLQPPGTAMLLAAALAADPLAGAAWSAREVGSHALAPYASTVAALGVPARRAYAGVGGVDLDIAAPALRDEVLRALAGAAFVGVRDRRTLGHLAAAGIAARLMPDPAVLTASLFGDRIRSRLREGEPAALASAWPDGWLAVQCSADFGDDATLALLAGQLERVVRASGLPLAIFRAGTAPWHDSLAVCRRLADRLPAGMARVMASPLLWDACALIVGSRGFLGSSLHGRILATAFGLPRVSLRHPDLPARPTKQDAWAATWDTALPAGALPLADAAAAMDDALCADPARLRADAARLEDACRAAFADMRLAIMA